jgi:hypothetical protein
MSHVWEYREPPEPEREPPERNRHPPTQAAEPWSPLHYSQTEHISRLQPRLPGDPPTRGRRPSFNPAAGQSRQPGAGEPQPDPWQDSVDEWPGSPAVSPVPRYQRPYEPQAYRPQYTAPPRYQPPPSYTPPYQPQQYGQRQYGQRQYGHQYRPPAPRRKRRVFLWAFLAVQVLFLVLIVTQVAAHPAGPTAAQQAAQQCANGGWQGLFKSQADCDKHYAVALNDASNVGKGIGVVVIVVIWMVIDFFLGLGYGIYRLASRH